MPQHLLFLSFIQATIRNLLKKKKKNKEKTPKPTKCQADTIVCDDGEAFDKSVIVPVAEDLSSGVH